MTHEYGYVASDYMDEIRSLADVDKFETVDKVIQFPFIEKVACSRATVKTDKKLTVMDRRTSRKLWKKQNGLLKDGKSKVAGCRRGQHKCARRRCCFLS